MTQISDVALTRRAQQFFAANHYDDAASCCADLLRRNPKHYQALLLMFEMALNQRKHAEMFDCARRLAAAYPRDGLAQTKLADYFNRVGRHEEAIRHLKRVSAKLADNADIAIALARTFEFSGDFQAGIDLLEPAIQSGNESAAVAYRYASLQAGLKNHRHVVEALSKHIDAPGTTPDLREASLFLLGQSFEALGDYDQAFQAFQAGNSVFPRQDYFAKSCEEYERLREAFSAQALRRIPRARTDSRLPICIVSRPRSGGTLLERIIAAHPAIHAGGENDLLSSVAARMNLLIGSTLPYPDCIRDVDQNDVEELSKTYLGELQSLDPRSTRISSKHMAAWKELGLLSCLCPRAAIIDFRRDAVDNCFAIYSAHLFHSRSFTSDLRDIGRYHREYERMMDHWHTVLDVPILRIDYEALVADQEKWTRKIIEFCGLPWDDRCLSFYEARNQSSSAGPTLSHQQVRQPIYKSSVSRAKRFEKHLGPLYEALGLSQPCITD